MKLVYKATQQPVKLGDKVKTKEGSTLTVQYFCEPHKPDSEGKVTIIGEVGGASEYYVSVIGAQWIEREDRA